MAASRQPVDPALMSNRPPVQQAERSAQPDNRRLREGQILDAAATLLVRWGYRKTTIDDVAREAGVGKGTIYLHWKDKSELFSAAILRACRQVNEDTLRRLAADPEGGRFHRLWTHGMLATLANPLLSALIQGKQEIFHGFMSAMRPELREQLLGNAEEHIVRLQRAGLIRTDLPVSVITFLIGALKLGIIHASGFIDQKHALSMAQLSEALSDLMRRWLEPEDLPGDSSAGRTIIAQWLEKTGEIAKQQQEG